MNLTELQEKRGRLMTEARAALDEIKTNTDDTRASELEARHDTIMVDFDKVEKTIEREERQAGIEARLAARAEEARKKQRPTGDDTEGRGADEGEKLEYRKVFAKMVCGADIGDLSTEERHVLSTGRAEFRAQTGGTTTAGGFTVPTELLREIEIAMKAHGPMYDGDVVKTITTSGGNPLKLPTVDDTASTAEPHTEGTALTDDGGKDLVFGQKSLDAFAFDTEFVRWSWELEMDSIFAMESLLGELLGERLARIANAKLTVGTGASQPNGIVTASGLGVTSVATSAVTFDELIDLEHSVDPAYRKAPSVGYMFNDTTLKALRKLKDGDGNYLWAAGNVQQGVPASLNGRSYHINQDMDSLAAAKKAILFGDLKKYWVRKVGAPIVGVLRERFWPDLGIAGLIRFDGELANQAAVKHLITAAA